MRNEGGNRSEGGVGAQGPRRNIRSDQEIYDRTFCFLTDCCLWFQEEHLADAERAADERHRAATEELEKRAQKMTVVALVCAAVAFASSVAEAMGERAGEV